MHCKNVGNGKLVRSSELQKFFAFLDGIQYLSNVLLEIMFQPIFSIG